MGLFSKLKSGLQKTKEKFASVFSKVFKIDRIGEEFYDELTDALVSADISVTTAMDVVDELRDEMIDGAVKDENEVKDRLKEILYDKVSSAGEIEYEYPLIIMVVGVNGVGKTTTIGKLCKHFLTLKKSVTVAAADTFRAAASEQLSIWADRADVRIIKHAEGADPSAVVYDALQSQKSKKTDVLIIDTAGRLHVKANLMEELKKIDRVIERSYPEAYRENLIVLDATTGQNALSQLKEFSEVTNITGIILTKMDGTAKGGIAVAIQAEMGIPVKYIGVGEQVEDLQKFDSDVFVNALFDVNENHDEQ